jgi:hypothetical protein
MEYYLRQQRVAQYQGDDEDGGGGGEEEDEEEEEEGEGQGGADEVSIPSNEDLENFKNQVRLWLD